MLTIRRLTIIVLLEVFQSIKAYCEQSDKERLLMLDCCVGAGGHSKRVLEGVKKALV